MTTAERLELGRLRRENRQLRIEREILSKAAAGTPDVSRVLTFFAFLLHAFTQIGHRGSDHIHPGHTIRVPHEGLLY
jgi:hypothetical protein